MLHCTHALTHGQYRVNTTSFRCFRLFLSDCSPAYSRHRQPNPTRRHALQSDLIKATSHQQGGAPVATLARPAIAHLRRAGPSACEHAQVARSRPVHADPE
jgi:hypothetical protein